MKDATLIVGDTLNFVRAAPQYPASAGWIRHYRLVPRVSGTPIDLVATASGDEYWVLVDAIETATWTPGEYTWSSWVEKNGERITLERNESCTILPDPAAVTAYDGRSWARAALETAQAAMATAGAIKRYAINGREVEYLTAAELLKRIAQLQAMVNTEDAADAVRKGKADPRRVYLRMRNA